jgi:hypothetical protein
MTAGGVELGPSLVSSRLPREEASSSPTRPVRAEQLSGGPRGQAASTPEGPGPQRPTTPPAKEA